MTPGEVAAYVTAVGGICTALGTLIGVFFKAWSDASVKRKQAETDAAKIMAGVHAEECEADDDRADRAYKLVIQELRTEVASLKSEYRELHKEHQSCVEMKAQLTERLNHQDKRIAWLEKKLEGRTEGN